MILLNLSWTNSTELVLNPIRITGGALKMKTKQEKQTKPQNYSPKAWAISLRFFFGRSVVGPKLPSNSDAEPGMRATPLGLPQLHWTLRPWSQYDTYFQQVHPCSQNHHSGPVTDFPFSISAEPH